MKRLLSLTLAVLLLFGALVPNFAFALEEDAPQENQEITVDDLEVYKRQVKAIRADVNSIETKNKHQVEMVQEVNEKTDELEVSIEKSLEAQGARMSFGQIYDLSSIPQRLILVGRLCVAIRFATTALRYKVDQAHVEIAEYVFQGLVIAVSPFHSVEDMKNHMLEFEALKAKLLTYPDITATDTANLYVRSDLDAKLHKARFLYRNDLKEAPSYVLYELNKVIRDVTRIRLQPQATVAEIYAADDRLDAAVGKAIAQVQDDKRATKTEYQDLREHRRLARQARRSGDNRRVVGEVIDSATKLIRDSRASSRKVQELIDMIRLVLELGPREN